MPAILKLYAQLARKAATLAVRGWPAALPLLVYPYLLIFAGALLAPLGLLGSLIAAVVSVLLISSYLALLAQAVAGSRLRLDDLKSSFTALFRDTMSALFSLWIIGYAVGMLTRGLGPQGQMIQVLVSLAMVVFFNPLPEVIYQRRIGGGGWFSHVSEATRFVLAHWPSWLLPNLALAALLLAPAGFLAPGPAGARLLELSSVFSPAGPTLLLSSVPRWLVPLMLLVIHWAMVWRGLLFQELSSGISARQRAFRDAWKR